MSETVATVVLRPASGSIDGTATVTSSNVDRFLPAPGVAARVASYFASLGFDAVDSGPISLSISAPQETFDRVFGTTGDDDTGDEPESLPTSALREDVAQLIAAIEFDPPPDFGPGNP